MGHPLAVVEPCGVRVFGRQPVPDRHDRGPGTVRELAGDVVHDPDAAHDVAAPVEVHHEPGRDALVLVDPNRHAVDDVVSDLRDVAGRREADRAARQLEQLRGKVDQRCGAFGIRGHPLDDPRVEYALVRHFEVRHL